MYLYKYIDIYQIHYNILCNYVYIIYIYIYHIHYNILCNYVYIIYIHISYVSLNPDPNKSPNEMFIF